MAITKEQIYRAAEQFSECRRKPKYCAYEDAKKIIKHLMQDGMPTYKAFRLCMELGSGVAVSPIDFVCAYQRFVLGSIYRRNRIEYIYTLLHG